MIGIANHPSSKGLWWRTASSERRSTFHGRHGGRPLLAGIGALCVIATGGCATVNHTFNRLAFDRWAADYESAERKLRDTGGELLLFYRDADTKANTSTQHALLDQTVRDRTARMVRCTLFGGYEPDRRYAAQYNVYRGPALIVVHGDGSYHKHVGRMSAGDIMRFLGSSTGGDGAAPAMNPHIPRRAVYNWHRSFESARALASETDRSLFIVFTRPFSLDWHRLGKLLDRRDVHRSAGTMVHCHLDTVYPSAKRQAKRFQLARLPAIVILEPNGTYRALELPVSPDAIVRFVDRSNRTRMAATAERDGGDETGGAADSGSTAQVVVP